MQRDNITAAEKKLNQLLISADKDLEGFIEFAAGLRLKLDYSLPSLDDVERLLTEFKGKPQFNYIEPDAWLYIGQVICRCFNGKWMVSNDVSNYRALYALPVITSFSEFNDVFCPTVEISKFLAGGNPGYFRTTILLLRQGRYISK